MNYEELVEHIRVRTIADPTGCWIWQGCCAKKKGGQTPVVRSVFDLGAVCD